MGSEIQDDFSGGMQDTDLGKGIPKNTYLYAKNLTFRGTELGIRPLIFSCSLATEGTLLNVFPYIIPALGSTVVHAVSTSTYVLSLYYLRLFTSSATRFHFKFPDSGGYSDGFLHTPHAVVGFRQVFLQIGNNVYFWITSRNFEKYAFKTTVMNVLSGDYYFTAVPLVCDTIGQSEWVPSACAGIFAYDRVFLGTKNDTYLDYNSVMVSKKVDSVSNPALYFDDTRVFTGGVKTEWVLGFSDLGSGNIAVIYENTVYVLRNCDGEPDGITSGIVCDFGCVGTAAFCKVSGEVWFVAVDGIYKILKDGRIDPVPITAAIGAWWVAHVGVSDKSSIATDGQRVFASLPLDGTTVNTVLVYNLVLGCWEGVWNGFSISALACVARSGYSGQLMFIASDGTMKWTSSSPGNLETGVTAQLTTRAFRGPAAYLPDLFTRANIEVNSKGVTGTPAVAVDAVCALSSVDQDTGVSVSHHSAVTMAGHGVHLCVICRVCQRIAVDMVFSTGLFYIRKIQMFFRGK